MSVQVSCALPWKAANDSISLVVGKAGAAGVVPHVADAGGLFYSWTNKSDTETNLNLQFLMITSNSWFFLYLQSDELTGMCLPHSYFVF